MPSRTSLCFELLVQKYCNHIHKLTQIHTLLITTGFFFKRETTTFVYNCLLKAYLHHGDPNSTLHLFTHMLSHQTQPNNHTFPSLIKAASLLSPTTTTRSLHAQITRRGLLLDGFINCCFVKFYAQLGELRYAREMFDEMSHPDLASCNSMLDALCVNGDLGSALFLFERLRERDVITWTSLINGFRKNGGFREAIWLFKRMMMHGLVRPNEATLVSVLSACANLDRTGALPLGREVHGYIVRHVGGMTAFLGTALIDMYSKHSHLGCSSNVFEAVIHKEVCTWNAMISALANNGKEAEALDMFDKMRAVGLRPNQITYVAVLTACARARLVDCGLGWFESMLRDSGVVPLMEHYGCVVDLLGRAGLLKETFEFIRRMPIEPDASVWGALLGACKVHGNSVLGADVGRQLLALQPWHCGRYAVLSNIFAGAGRWDDAAGLREDMEKAGIKKIAGYSWIGSRNNLL